MTRRPARGPPAWAVRASGVSLTALALLAAPALAQSYRARIDSRVQGVSYRGVTLETVSRSAVDSIGGFTFNGFAVNCLPGAAACSYFAPGPERRGGPFVTTADVSVWGLGIRGLRVRATGRLGLSLGDGGVWPGTDPAGQLLEAYGEYANRRLTVQLGRTHRATRFGWTGFDGALATVRATGAVTITGYGGWGLARGVALPVTSPALNPLDDFQPRDRQIVAGADAVLRLTGLTGRVLYQREVDPGIDAFVSERAGIDLALRPLPGVSVTAGGDYDLANGWFGSGEATVGYVLPRGRASVTLGGRRYRPHFPLWTIWGAFSPVPYRAGFAVVSVRPFDRLDLRAQGEVYAYDEAEAATPLAGVEGSGWRWSWGATWQADRRVTLDGGFHAEFGPGGASRGFEGAVTWLPTPRIHVTAHGAQLLRPLEFRFDESEVWVFGVSGAADLTTRIRLTAAATRYDELRDRADAAAFEWDQVRLSAGVQVTLGAPFDRARLPAAFLRIPEGNR